jgi:hypothetical protein
MYENDDDITAESRRATNNARGVLLGDIERDAQPAAAHWAGDAKRL